MQRRPLPRNATDRAAIALATGLYTGYLPAMPGTWGTLATIPLYLLMAQLPAWVYISLTLGLLALGVIAAERVGGLLGRTPRTARPPELRCRVSSGVTRPHDVVERLSHVSPAPVRSPGLGAEQASHDVVETVGGEHQRRGGVMFLLFDRPGNGEGDGIEGPDE